MGKGFLRVPSPGASVPGILFLLLGREGRLSDERRRKSQVFQPVSTPVDMAGVARGDRPGAPNSKAVKEALHKPALGAPPHPCPTSRTRSTREAIMSASPFPSPLTTCQLPSPQQLSDQREEREEWGQGRHDASACYPVKIHCPRLKK